MSLFGIEVTLGHLVFALIAIALNDLFWNLIVPDKWSDWWYQHKQVPLRAMLYGAVITITVMASINPTLALWLLAGFILLVGGYFWWQHNQKTKGLKKEKKQ